jgi:hypothetical protein
MLLFGHRFIESPRFYHIDDVEAIAHTPANSLLFIEFSETNLDIIDLCRTNNLNYAIEAATLREVIYAANFGAAYIVVEEELAQEAQKIAETYLFDAKILCRIEEESAIEEIAEQGIDGVIFAEAIVKISG